jgi:RNA polymerase sigma-70 factor (ECF subfamily)
MNEAIGFPLRKNKILSMRNFFQNNIKYYRMQDESKTDSQATEQAEYLSLLIPVKKKLYNFVYKSLNFSSDSDDIYQETLLKGFKYFASYDREKNFNTWLFTIANNLIKDYYRSKKVVISIDDSGIAIASDDSAREQIREIHHAVQRLKPNHRQIFFLFYYNEFKISEIASITGMTQSNIKFILNQSRKRLKQFLEVKE